MALILTASEVQKLEEDLTRQQTLLEEVQNRIAEASALGDLSENEEYSTALQARDDISNKILTIKNSLDNHIAAEDDDYGNNDVFKSGSLISVEIVNYTCPEDALFGFTKRETYGEKLILCLGNTDSTVTSGILGMDSPLGKALLSQYPGEFVIEHRISGNITFNVQFATDTEISWFKEQFPDKATVLTRMFAV